MDDKHITAYLWDDVPAHLRARILVSRRTPLVLLCVPARWGERFASLLPEALATLVEGYSPAYWGHVERFHQPDGSLLIVCSRAEDL